MYIFPTPMMLFFSVSERAKLVMELERQNAVVQDLSMQLSQVNCALEQARSRLYIFEGKMASRGFGEPYW